MEKTITFYTLGWRLNQSETAVLSRQFELNGYRVVGFDQPADYVVINTCTVTEHGDADTRHLVNKANRVNPHAKIALIGCQAQIQKEKLTQLPNVRLVVGNGEKMNLFNILQEVELSEKPVVIAPPIEKKSFTLPAAGIDSRHTRANLKIQDGCDFFCSFCEIPYARGRARSRVFADILKEAHILAEAGYKEVVLTGVNLGEYDFEGRTILDVIDALEGISGLERIRISSIEPTTVPFNLIEKMNNGKLCRYLHIPLQSGSEEILKSMQRKYTKKEFADFIYRVTAAVPQVCIGTDIIVGFPGETERHFEETVEFVRELPLAYFHVFSYSDRSFNKSRLYANKISPKVIQERSKILRQLSLRKRQLFLHRLIGSKQKVLFEEKKGSDWFGLTDHYARVKLTSPDELKNQIRSVFLKRLDDQILAAHA